MRAGALLLLHPAAGRAQTVWDMPTEYPQTAMPGLGVTTFAKQLVEGFHSGAAAAQRAWCTRSGPVCNQVLDAFKAGKP